MRHSFPTRPLPISKRVHYIVQNLCYSNQRTRRKSTCYGSPPIIVKLSVDVDGGASNGNDAVEVVVLTADSLAGARVSWDTNNADGAAGQANRDVHILNDGAHRCKDDSGGRILRGADAVAALDGTSRARRSSGCSNGSGGKNQSGEELELHDEDEDCWVGRAGCFSEVLGMNPKAFYTLLGQ